MTYVPPYRTIHHLGVVSCQCEHDAHWAEDPTPGHSCHKYMAEFNPSEIVKVHTVFGWYEMCKDCANSLPADMRIKE